MLITFEGIDGGGKSTHIQTAAAYLRAQGLNVLVTREPGGTDIGEQIRPILLDHKNKGIAPETELLLFNASRAQLVHEVLRPHLAKGGVVLLDRFYDSTLAYQGYGRGLDPTVLRQIINFATGGLTPDLTLYLDLSPQVAHDRRYQASLLGEEFNRLDQTETDFRLRVVEGYEALIAAEPQRFTRINAEQALEHVAAEVLAALQHRIQLTLKKP
ncbi:MAG: dTMP kinase [Phototrophicaceae bacterium]|jgi:dTMP kinase